jgi:hypothetical protein
MDTDISHTSKRSRGSICNINSFIYISNSLAPAGGGARAGAASAQNGSHCSWRQRQTNRVEPHMHDMIDINIKLRIRSAAGDPRIWIPLAASCS